MKMNGSGDVELLSCGSMKDAVLKLALPTVLGQMITVIYNMADTFFIGMLADDARMTAVTVAMPAFMLLSAVSNLFGIGGAGAVSRALGRNDRKDAEDTAAFAFWGALIAGAVYSVLVGLFADPLTDALGGRDPRVHDLTVSYILVAVSAGGPMTVMSVFLSHMLRAEGRGGEASFGIVMGGVLNIILDPLFMFCIMPEGLEVAGAALATALSNMCSMFYFIGAVARKRKGSVLRFSPVRAVKGARNAGDVFSSGLPAFTMTVCENVSYAVLDSLIAGYGIALQAGVGVAKKINMLAHSIVRGMSQGMLPLIAYSYSSGDGARMRKASRCSSLFSVIAALACMTVSLLFSDSLAAVFLEEGSESAVHAARMLRLFALGAPFSAFAYSSVSFFQATGRGGRSFLLAVLRKGIIDIPLMFVLAGRFGAYGAAAATPAADAVCACAAVALMVSFMRKEAPGGREPAEECGKCEFSAPGSVPELGKAVI